MPSDWLLILDFDGTVTTEDIALQVLRAYAAPGWEAYDGEYEAGRITLAECVHRQFGMIRASRQTIQRFARERAVVRPGLRDLLDWCRLSGVGLQILSAGLDVYIEAVLEREGLTDSFDAVHCIRTDFACESLRCQVPDLGAPGPEDADYKQTHVARLRAAGWRVAYAGDGSTDRGAAAVADRVFARASLLRFCRESGIASVPFETFHEIHENLRGLVGG
jgi:2-hydroxy-3-keto-5-methylthiopentenyl-1-phosphate phosphatase